jgi:hypothetical protein
MIKNMKIKAKKKIQVQSDEIDIPDKILKPIIKEVADLTTSRTAKIELTNDLWIQFEFLWIEDDEMQIDTYKLVSTNKKIKRLIKNENLYLAYFDSDECMEILKPFNVRITKVCKIIDDLERKYDVELMNGILEKAGVF